jgi:hypothetical protein
MTRIVHFEIAAGDTAATVGFYSAVFGWPTYPSPFVPEYHMMDLGEPGGATGAVMGSKYCSQPAIVWFEVASLDDTLAAVARAGGTQINEKQTLSGIGHLVYAADPTGTVFGLRQPE